MTEAVLMIINSTMLGLNGMLLLSSVFTMQVSNPTLALSLALFQSTLVNSSREITSDSTLIMT